MGGRGLRIERPVRSREHVDEIRARGGELVVDGPGRGEDAAASFGGAAACQQAQYVADCVGVERLPFGTVGRVFRVVTVEHVHWSYGVSELYPEKGQGVNRKQENGKEAWSGDFVLIMEPRWSCFPRPGAM